MSSSTLDHTCPRAEACSCGLKFETFSAYFEEDGRETKRRRPIINSELPEDVLLEILLRLPIKSLLRFKSVCKFWYDLIRSPKFMSLHDANSKKEKKGVTLYCHSYSGGGILTTISMGSFDAVPLDLLPLELTVTAYVEHVELVGCCNGIVCLSLTHWHHKIALWNPATRQSRILSLPPPRGSQDFSQDVYSGFFFDSVANSCKLVRIMFLPHQEPSPLLMEQPSPKPEGTISGVLHIFTLKTNSWRKKELLVPCRFPWGGFMGPVTYLKRCMYWIVSVRNILCLDMEEELVKLIELPCADHVYCDKKLVEYKGSLAMFVWQNSDSDSPGRCFDMWLLNDRGDTWCKQLTLRPSVANVKRPVGFFSKDGVDFVLLYTPGQCLLWDKDSGETTKVIVGKGYVYPYFHYCESFASVY